MNDIDAMLLKMWHSIYNYYTVRKFDRKNEEGEKIRKNDLHKFSLHIICKGQLKKKPSLILNYLRGLGSTFTNNH